MNARKTKEPKAAGDKPAPKVAISKEQMYRILRAPVITEKATRGSERPTGRTSTACWRSSGATTRTISSARTATCAVDARHGDWYNQLP